MAEQVQVGNVSIMAVQDTPVSGSRPFMFPDVPDEAWQGWEHYFNPRGNLRMNIGTSRKMLELALNNIANAMKNPGTSVAL